MKKSKKTLKCKISVLEAKLICVVVNINTIEGFKI